MWKPETSVVKHFDRNDAIDGVSVEVVGERLGHVLRKFDGIDDSNQGFRLHGSALKLGPTQQYLLAIASVADNLYEVPYRILR